MGTLNAVIIASGPSLTDEQCAIAQDYRQQGKCKIITINRTFEKTQSDYIVAADGHVWDKYIKQMKEISPDAELWGHHKRACDDYGLNRFECINSQKGLSRELPKVSGGCNSGHMAINLAYLWGFRNIALLGFDYQHTAGKAHYFGDHEDKSWSNAQNCERWLELIRPMAKELESEGVNVVNCTTYSAIDCFPERNIKGFFYDILG